MSLQEFKKNGNKTNQTNQTNQYDFYKNDFQTPPDVAEYMVSLLEPSIQTVLEPTPGIGNIVRALDNARFIIACPSDYFLLPKDFRYDAVCMNPPFSSKFVDLTNAPLEIQQAGMRMGYWFLTDCMRRSDRVVALMPWFTISDSDVRLRTLVRWGLRSVTALPRRTFRFARIQTVVLNLEKGYKGKTDFLAFDCLKDSEINQLEIPSLNGTT